VLESKKVLVVSTVMVASVPSVIWAHESRLPRDRVNSSDWLDWRRKLRHLIISSVVLWRRKPRAIRISSVVDWRRIGGAFGDGSRDEHVELESGDLRGQTLIILE